MKNKKTNVILIIIVTIVVLFLALKDDFIEKVIYLFSFKKRYLLCAFILIILYWILKALVIYYCSRKFKKNYSFKQAFKLLLDTQLVNGITPFAVGGQPYQIYRLKKQGFSFDQGTNIVIQDFIVYQISLVLLGTIAIIVNHSLSIFPQTLSLKILVFLGYFINLTVLVMLFVLAFNKKLNKIILEKALKIGVKFKIIKNKTTKKEEIDEKITNFHNSALELIKSKTHFIKIIVINFFALVFLYLIPYTLIKGLNIDINPFIVIFSSAYVMLIGSFVIIPGGSGGIEYGFVNFFGTFIKGAQLSSIMIAWRVITYYLGIIVGAVTLNIKEDS